MAFYRHKKGTGKPKARPGKGVLKNKFEKTANKELETLWGKENVAYETETFEYVVPATKKKYTPDFKKKGSRLFVETKGYWDAADRQKMKLIVEQHPEIKVRMYFVSGNKPIRKGSKTTYGEWCDKIGIEWSDQSKGIPKSWTT